MKEDDSARWYKGVPVLLWLPRDAFYRVMKLKDKLGLSSVQEVFRCGFKLLEWYYTFYRPGCKIMVSYPETPDVSLVTMCDDPPDFRPVTKH